MCRLVTPCLLALLALGCGSDVELVRDPEPEHVDDPSPGVNFEPVAYPPGPYGTRGTSVVPNFEFRGWPDPPAVAYDPARLDYMSLGEFWDPDGAKDIRYILMNASAVWCTFCRQEMRDIKSSGRFASYREKGVLIIGTLYEDNSGNPAKPEDLELWGSMEGHEIEFPLLLDPSFQTQSFMDYGGTPLNVLIDAKTMRIVHNQIGFTGSIDTFWSTIDALTAQ